jgi:hypothetical protein
MLQLNMNNDINFLYGKGGKTQKILSKQNLINLKEKK